METRDKKILIQSVSAVLVILVLFNVYSGITVSKIGIPGLIDIEFNTGKEPAQQENHGQTEGQGTILPEDNNGPLQNGGQSVTPANSGQRQSTGQTDNDERDVYPPADPGSVIPSYLNLNGVWYGADGSEYEISEEDGIIYFTEYGMFGITAEGSGSYQNNRVILDYQTVFGTTGRATLEVLGNGQILSGRADDFTSGASTALYLTKE